MPKRKSNKDKKAKVSKESSNETNPSQVEMPIESPDFAIPPIPERRRPPGLIVRTGEAYFTIDQTMATFGESISEVQYSEVKPELLEPPSKNSENHICEGPNSEQSVISTDPVSPAEVLPSEVLIQPPSLNMPHLLGP